MNDFGLAFLLINATMLMLLPRRWAPAPLLVGACYMTLGQEIEIGALHFPIIRILIAVGIVRVILRGERPAGRMNSLDWLMVVWGVWALISSVFHKDFSAALINRLGLAYNACGIYFLLRVFCQSLDDVARLCRLTSILLVPVAIEMIVEKMLGHNFFSVFGSVAVSPEIREGRIRAQGPFAHSILAGTVGAVCLPLMIGLWRQYRKYALVGIVACLAMVVASASSGPIVSGLAAVGALLLWRWRHRMSLVRWLSVLGYIGLDVVMKAPAYYLISRFDLAGGSTGWHRARLIESSIEHLSEWWMGGTDYTRHWMPTGVPWSEDHTDITNHYLKMGVLGGLPLMLLFIAVIAKGFSFVGMTLREATGLDLNSRFMLWALGASLFAQTVTFVSVSYFDQSFIFLYLVLAAIGSARSATVMFSSS